MGRSGKADSWTAEAARDWPAAKGSLTEVRKTCGKKGCRRCASGEKHPAWLFIYRTDGKTASMHVPKSLAPALAAALENGRLLEKQLVANGVAMIRGRRKK